MATTAAQFWDAIRIVNPCLFSNYMGILHFSVQTIFLVQLLAARCIYTVYNDKENNCVLYEE
jgi:hypothetical protein